MHVTVIDPDAPYPPTSGKRLRSLNLLLPLAKRHHLTYLFRAEPERASEMKAAVEHLTAAGVTPLPVEQALPSKGGPRFALRLAANLFSSLPYSVATHLGAPLREAVRRHAATAQVDLWHLEWAGCFDLLPSDNRRPVVVDSHNVDTLIWRRYHETETRRLHRWYLRRQWRKFEGFERRVFAAATCVVTVSPDDAAIVRAQFGVDRTEVVDNGIDRAYFEATPRRRDPQQILFLGSLDWRPNLDALRLLLDDIFPAVRAAEAAARLVVVGRRPPGWLLERTAKEPGVELHADVPDVRPFLGGGGVLAVPLRVGGGSRLKILEALATGLPVVSTRVGAEGLLLRPGEHYVAAEPDEMAAALIDAVRHPERLVGQAEAGQRVVLERYDWAGLSERLGEVWEKAVRSSA
jgi:glycosyltransferase involved in cell wall biosynthesis